MGASAPIEPKMARLLSARAFIYFLAITYLVPVVFRVIVRFRVGLPLTMRSALLPDGLDGAVLYVSINVAVYATFAVAYRFRRRGAR